MKRIALLSVSLLWIFCSKSPFDTSTTLGSSIVNDVDSTVSKFGDHAIIDTMGLAILDVSSRQTPKFGMHAGEHFFVGNWAGTGETAKAYCEFTIDSTFFKTHPAFDLAASPIVSASLILKIDPKISAIGNSALSDLEIHPFTLAAGAYLDSMSDADAKANTAPEPLTDPTMVAMGLIDTFSHSLNDSLKILNSEKSQLAKDDSLINACKATLTAHRSAKNPDTTTLLDSLQKLNSTRNDHFYLRIGFVITRPNGTLAGFLSNSAFKPQLRFRYLSNSADTITALSPPEYAVFEPKSSIAGLNAQPVSSCGSGRRAIYAIDIAPLREDYGKFQAAGVIAAYLSIQAGPQHLYKGDSLTTDSIYFRYTLADTVDTLGNSAFTVRADYRISNDSMHIALPVNLRHELSRLMRLVPQRDTAYLTLTTTSSPNAFGSIQWTTPLNNKLYLEAVFAKTPQ